MWVVAALLTLSALSGCKDRRKVQSTPPIKKRQPACRSLLLEAARAEMWSHGLLINLGTPDQHKYLSRGWAGQRIPVRDAGGALLAEVPGGLELSFHDWRGGIKVLRLRARSDIHDQQVILTLDGQEVGRSRLSPEIKELKIPLKQSPAPGRRLLRLDFSRTPPKGPAALVDWIWFSTLTEGRPPGRLKRRVSSFPDPQRALVGDPPRTYSYYLSLPPGAALVFSHAASAETRFRVEVSADGKPAQRLTEVAGGRGKWKRARADLGQFGGKLVRLDLITEGEGGQAAWGEPELVCPANKEEAKPAAAAKRARNLIHLMVDTARRDASRSFNPRAVASTPTLARLVHGGVTFTAAYTNANWTLPSVASMLTGRYPIQAMLQTDQEKVTVLPRHHTLLSEQLRRHGFHTAAITASPWVSKATGLSRGWDYFREYEGHPATKRAQTVYGDALEWLRKKRPRGKRFYLYLHTLDPHAPYYRNSFTSPAAVAAYRGRFARGFREDKIQAFNSDRVTLEEQDRDYIKALYHGEIAYHDHHLGQFMAEVRRQGLLDDTLVVYTNDHGEELFDHHLLGHGHTMFEELVQAIWVLRLPGGRHAGRRLQQPVELVDLAPTLLEALGVAPTDGVHGVSQLGRIRGLSDAGAGYVVVRGVEDAIRVGSYKLILGKDHQALYDLARDPGEHHDQIKRQPIARRACEVHFAEAMAVPNKRLRLTHVDSGEHPTKVERRAIDSKLRARLKALGYIQ